MLRVTLTTAAIALVCTTAKATRRLSQSISPCECRDNHGKGRWAVKTDSSLPPANVGLRLSGLRIIANQKIFLASQRTVKRVS
jgi:hypothetical protein